MRVEVSTGELLDKYSILEIKSAKINDEEKRAKVRIEQDRIGSMVQPFLKIPAIKRVYDELKKINVSIWEMNDKCIALESFDGRPIMNANNARFIAKSKINELSGSYLSEVKSYELGHDLPFSLLDL